jgi:hypothetical protein
MVRINYWQMGSLSAGHEFSRFYENWMFIAVYIRAGHWTVVFSNSRIMFVSEGSTAFKFRCDTGYDFRICPNLLLSYTLKQFDWLLDVIRNWSEWRQQEISISDTKRHHQMLPFFFTTVCVNRCLNKDHTGLHVPSWHYRCIAQKWGSPYMHKPNSFRTSQTYISSLVTL